MKVRVQHFAAVFAMSADGSIQTAVVLEGQIYVSSPGRTVLISGTVKIGAWHDQSVSPNGYTWIGNILYQWGTGTSSSDDAQTFTFPIPFPNQCFTANPTIPCRVTLSSSGFTIDRHNDYDGSIVFTYLAIGH